ncbi:hypothetical protein HIM_09828 [Hirsutella minnesotensis 3608]|uniref:Uncharacterized protein n=1 Tax=Hirsutella minnesotensis 3608 TaxID=1043627 RepID=A0A0F7ZS56_9HYPO|nr:hypothetical protein HIM_09828 [Hirsutella minnesotensis 3608]
MPLMAKILDHLDRISDMIPDMRADADFATLSDKVMSLYTALAVYRSLEITAQNLQNSVLPHAQSRLSKFMDAVYGPGDVKKEERLQKLRSFRHEDFIFVSISYTPLDITKMSRAEFDCLVETVPVYLPRRDLPARWIFRDEIQVSIASKASLRNAAEFRKGYYALEFQQDLDHDPPPSKRIRLENHSYSVAEQHDLVATSEPASVAPISEEKPPNEDSRSALFVQLDKIISDLLGIVFQCSGADVGKLEKVLADGSLLNAIKDSHQWKWERDRDAVTDVPRTDCFLAMIPDSDQDMSLMIRAGYWQGWAIAAQLGFQKSEVLSM